MTRTFPRRGAIRTMAAAFAVLGTTRRAAAQQQTAGSPARPQPLADDLVHQFVQVAHRDLEATRTLLDGEPRLIRAAWDWGGGDVETALGGAAHMGRRDIATFLLDRGAPFDLFAAAMLGDLTMIRAALEARPALVRVPGPHGIPLIAHAKAGGPQAAAVQEYVSTVLARSRPEAK